MITSPVQLLKPYQRAVYDDACRFIAWIAGRQVGKSFTGAARAVKTASVAPKTDFLIASPSERQSFEAVLKCRDWAEAFDFAVRDVVEERDAPGALMKAATIEFRNGSRIIAVPGKPDTVRGYSAHVWMDEFAFFEDPDATWKAILPSISNPLRGLKTAFITSTPNGRSGRGRRFYEIVTDKGAIDPEGRHAYQAGVWSVHRTPITFAAKWLGTDVDALRAAVDDEEAWQQEFLCGFVDGTNVLLPYDLLAKCESIEASADLPPESLAAMRPEARLFAGIDFGRTSDPTVMWILEQVGDVLWTRGVKVFRNVNTVDQFAALAPYIERCARVCVDYTGPGVGFGDMVQKEFGAARTGADALSYRCELCTFSVPFKCEIFPKLRTAMDGMRLRIPVDVECREDLHEMQQVIRDGKYNYMAKRTAEGHSDRCTALALAVRAAGMGGEYVRPFGTGRLHSPDARRM